MKLLIHLFRVYIMNLKQLYTIYPNSNNNVQFNLCSKKWKSFPTSTHPNTILFCMFVVICIYDLANNSAPSFLVSTDVQWRRQLKNIELGNVCKRFSHSHCWFRAFCQSRRMRCRKGANHKSNTVRALCFWCCKCLLVWRRVYK